MEQQNVPFVSYHAEVLRDKLKSEIDRLAISIRAQTELQFGYYGNENYKIDWSGIWDIVDAFQAECRDNFLQVSDKKMATRYAFLLSRYFSFIPEKIVLLNDYESDLRDRSWAVETTSLEEKEEAEDYYVSLQESNWHLIKGLEEINQIIEECRIYFIEGVKTVSDATTEMIDIGKLSVNNELQPKLTWSCKPAVAGYIISELIRAGYVNPPTTNGELSLTKLAKICDQLFDIAGHNPSQGSWRNVLDPERNTLSDHKRARLNLPDSDQLL
jgi:hypothetical protein